MYTMLGREKNLRNARRRNGTSIETTPEEVTENESHERSLCQAGPYKAQSLA
jgi:hypothetical protein